MENFNHISNLINRYVDNESIDNVESYYYPDYCFYDSAC